MGITNANKEIDVDRIDCDGVLHVTLALTAAPDIAENPTDIVLVLDRSGSMAGSALANMKVGAKTFLDIIEEATDGTQDGVIGSGSHVGIVSFSNTATADTGLLTSVADLKAAVDALTAGGATNHADAFAKAVDLFDPLSSNAKVIVLFTDGKTTAGPPPSPVAAAARASGIVIYCIGLLGTDGIDVDVLNDWASDPDASHVAVTPDETELEELFKDLARNISKPGATNVFLLEKVNPDFRIQSLSMPTKGAAVMLDANTIQWTIDELGVSGNEGASLTFAIQHIAQTSGEKFVNESVMYEDSEGNDVVFPTPSVQVTCGGCVHPEPCPEPVNVTIGRCEDVVSVDAGDVCLDGQGRILQLDVTVKNVCPGKRVALAVLLTEVDGQGAEFPRGIKTLVIPAHTGPCCHDVCVKGIPFVLPESLSVSCNNACSMCKARNFKVRFLAHNIDTAYHCGVCGPMRP